MSSSSGVTPEHPQPPESPLDVLSRAASMVEEEESASSNISVGGASGEGEGEAGQSRNNRGVGGRGMGSPSSTSADASPPRVSPTQTSTRTACDRVPSFKERHPKFRKNCTPDYMVAADQASMHAKIGRQNSGGAAQSASASPPPAPDSPPSRLQIAEATTPPLDLHPRVSPPADVDSSKPEEQEGPLDFSMKKRRSASPPPPPPYRFTPLTAQRVTPQAAELTVKTSAVVPAVSRSLQPPPPPYPMAAILRPPPPSYESATIKHGFPTPEALRLAALELEERERVRKLRLQQEEEEEERRRQRMRKLAAEKAAKAAAVAAEKERPVKEITIITDSSADPSLDEHFRRSLGAKYQELFKDKEEEIEVEETKPRSPSPPPAAREDTSEPMDVTVDDDELKVTSTKNRDTEEEEEDDPQEGSEGFSGKQHLHVNNIRNID